MKINLRRFDSKIMFVVVKNLFQTSFLIHRIIIKLSLTSYHVFDLSKGKKIDVKIRFFCCIWTDLIYGVGPDQLEKVRTFMWKKFPSGPDHLEKVWTICSVFLVLLFLAISLLLLKLISFLMVILYWMSIFWRIVVVFNQIFTCEDVWFDLLNWSCIGFGLFWESLIENEHRLLWLLVLFFWRMRMA